MYTIMFNISIENTKIDGIFDNNIVLFNLAR